MSAENKKDVFARGEGLYLILTAPTIPHEELAAAACERGVGALQLREKDVSDSELLELALALADVTKDTETLLIINDRPDIAAAAAADGVHLGRSDTSVATARSVLGEGALIGLSTRTPDEAQEARSAGADYIGVGPVFPTDTKPDALSPIGLAGLRAVAGRVPGLPLVAIGGITSSNASGVLDAGARYLAVISDVCHADDPIAALDAFLSRAVRGSHSARERGEQQ